MAAVLVKRCESVLKKCFGGREHAGESADDADDSLVPEVDQNVTTQDHIKPSESADSGVIELSDALAALAAEDPDSATVVELRYFAGAKWAEVAEAIGQSVDDAKEVWAYAKAWLYHRLAAG